MPLGHGMLQSGASSQFTERPCHSPAGQAQTSVSQHDTHSMWALCLKVVHVLRLSSVPRSPPVFEAFVAMQATTCSASCMPRQHTMVPAAHQGLPRP